MRRAAGAALSVGAFVAVGLASGELGARVDDRVFGGQPILESPTFQGLFFTLDDGIRRGRPRARWGRVEMNNLGMRGPDIAPERPAGCERWLFLGASETFGEPGFADGDFPSAVRAAVPAGHCVEVANSASPGMGLRNMTEQFDAYLSRIGATRVFIYPPTQLYLREIDPRRSPSEESRRTAAGVVPAGAASQAPRSIGDLLERSRFVERLKASAEVPAPIQAWRRARWIDAAVRSHPPEWLYAKAPLERLDSLDADLTTLIGMIRASGATPVLMSHAVRAERTPRPVDSTDLIDMRVYFPQALPGIIAEFEYEAAERTRAVAARLGVEFIDVAAEFSGRRDRFIDLVHFSPAGNQALAALILRSVPLPATNGAARALQ